MYSPFQKSSGNFTKIRFGPDSKPNEKVWISFIEKLLLLHSTLFSFWNSIIVQQNHFKRIYLTWCVKGTVNIISSDLSIKARHLNLCTDMGNTLICIAWRLSAGNGKLEVTVYTVHSILVYTRTPSWHLISRYIIKNIYKILCQKKV